jgi:hypothetical protein
VSDRNLTYHSRRGQEVFLVLFALSEMGGIQDRQAVLDFITNQEWYELVSDDLIPTSTTREARYRIDLAWARKDGVLADYINNFERNSWELNREGRDFIDEALNNFQSGKWDLGKCAIFTLKFKHRIFPRFESRASDVRRFSLQYLLRKYSR